MQKIFNKLLIGFIFTLIIFLFNTSSTAAAVSVTVFANNTTGSITVAYGTQVQIKWQSTGATSCAVTAPAGYTDAAGGTGTTGNFTTEALTDTSTFTVRCTDYVAAPSCTRTINLVTCFVSDTIVIMVDGSKKNIQDVKVGDVLKGEKTNNKVLGLHRPELNGKLYSFNDGRYFVTEGWKSINPKKTLKENIGILVTELKVGDTLITEKGKVLIKTIKSKEEKPGTDLFNFFLDGDHTYYADGYLVHNKDSCSPGYPCGTGQQCINSSEVPSTSGTCALCPGTCNVGETATCSSGYTKCTNTKCMGGSCSGTVAGAVPSTNEGENCSIFTSRDSCEQGWATHGCHWTNAL